MNTPSVTEKLASVNASAPCPGSAPASNREFDWVDDPSNQHVRYLILPTVKRMQAIDARKLTIEIRSGKILFEMLPAEGVTEMRQPEQNDQAQAQPPTATPELKESEL